MKYFLLALSVVFIFMACSKKTTPALSRTDMLRNGQWAMSSASISVKLPNGKKDTTFNYFDYMPKCHHDDFLTFNSVTDGAVHSNGTLCSPHDPDSVGFKWSLGNNDNNISIFRGFSLIWSIVETVQPLRFDTLQQLPYLILDTVHGYLDTLYKRFPYIVLDSIWKLHFDSLYVPTFDIYNAAMLNFTESSFTINFTMLSTYPDTTHNHTGRLIDTNTPPDTSDFDPVILQDTVKYTITFNKH